MCSADEPKLCEMISKAYEDGLSDLQLVENIKDARFENADINITTHQGVSPLHLATSKGYMRVFQLLMERGANPFARTSSGIPIHAYAKASARSTGDTEPEIARYHRIELLRAYVKTGTTPEFSASLFDDKDSVQVQVWGPKRAKSASLPRKVDKGRQSPGPRLSSNPKRASLPLAFVPEGQELAKETQSPPIPPEGTRSTGMLPTAALGPSYSQPQQAVHQSANSHPSSSVTNQPYPYPLHFNDIHSNPPYNIHDDSTHAPSVHYPPDRAVDTSVIPTFRTALQTLDANVRSHGKHLDDCAINTASNYNTLSAIVNESADVALWTVGNNSGEPLYNQNPELPPTTDSYSRPYQNLWINCIHGHPQNYE